jgi:uncharacterized membrane-anchored protein YhcB (DUF1043 family)
MSQTNITSVIRENKTRFIIIAVGLFLIELEIFAVSAMKSGRNSWMQVINDKGNVIHETDGNHLSDFDRYHFEKTFGPFEQYQVRLVTKNIPFPFRAWFVAAVGIPVGVILLFGFVVKAYMSLFYGEEKKANEPYLNDEAYETRFERIIARVSRFNIFIIGFFVFLAVFSYWVVPNLITYAGRVGIETLTRYKWLFLSVAIVILGIMVWVIYLRYLLAKKTIDGQTEIEKYRLQLEFDQNRKFPHQLEYNRNETNDRPLVTWDESDGMRCSTNEVRLK